MPMTGYFNSRHEELEWVEGNLENWNAYFTLRGTGEILYENDTFRTSPGDLVLLSPGVHRSYRIPFPSQGWEFYWLHFRATPRLSHMLDWFDRRNVRQIHKVVDVPLRTRIALQLEELHQLNLGNPDMPWREAMLEASLEALILRVAAAEKQEIVTSPVDTRIEHALEYFHRDIAAPTDIGRLAQKAGLSRSQFCLLFRQGTGFTPQQYIEERRLEMAAYYLRISAQSVTEVADMVGFSNAFYFASRFRKRFGTTPTKYRKSSVANTART
jgi:AraC family transcriptional regulator of arabinose operon